MNSGNVGGETDDIELEVSIGANVLDSIDVTPVKSANTFVGWGYDDAGATMVGASDLVTADLTVYAIFEAND